MNITGLLRVTVAAPQRRLDLALPEQASVAEVLPGLLTKAGEHLADQAAPDGGWVLRRADGTELSLGRTLGSHRIRDGEILHLVPRELDWPELEYDDLVDAVASGAGRLGAIWTARHTRAAGLIGAAASLLVGLTAILRHASPWAETATWLLLSAVLLIASGVSLARVVGDSGAGALVAGIGLLFAGLGGLLLLAGVGPWPAIGAPQVLAGGTALMLAGIACYLGVVDKATLFAGATSTGLLALIAGWIGTAESLGGPDVAALVGSAAFAFSPFYSQLCLRLGRLPMPILPRTTADLVRDDPQPARREVYGAVLRADGLLTGALIGMALTVSTGLILLTLDRGVSANLLTGLLAAGCLLRARIYPVVKHRLLFLVPGLVGLACLALGPLSRSASDPIAMVVPIAILFAAATIFLGLRYSGKLPSPYLSRYAEIVEVLVTLSLIPLACSVLGLYAVVRGWGG
ncbi:type VII secretion integral membrane protein EccD [Kribbella sandramycini]|uniref:Type VII secretion integral membrane protein EccD n=1 Tax=Kribbella sandramycini TaxID=60450 RepID=A0A7Y4L2D5_9ACTN|nr:type VII secretion integral membrane protein EccD [Kribbella sandramycini]MBB6566255.1 type VII secretion integral membrane protein EccD [Kribbella sandramycini]NOL43080.1 type VII secretion integral membrane protein EccD [Kribbella sandramycini]